MSHPPNRRSYRRFRVSLVECQYGRPSDPQGAGAVREVALNSAFVEHDEPPPVGDRVLLEFTGVPLEGYRIEGVVVRSQQRPPRGFAVRFSRPHPRLLRAVHYEQDEPPIGQLMDD